MCEVARRAGVGQATLYRNFPDRRALAAEVLGEHVERIARLAAEHAGDPDAFFVLLKSLVESTVHLYAVSELAREDACVGSQLERDRQRVAELMKRPLREAKAAGILRRDMSLDDVFLVLLMARGAMERKHGAAARASAASPGTQLRARWAGAADRTRLSAALAVHRRACSGHRAERGVPGVSR